MQKEKRFLWSWKGQRRLQDLNAQYKNVMDRLEEEGLIIEGMPELISCAIIIPK